ncbi:protein kinase domain-containing protein [Sorangium sp. So ce131]|uniref:serine/threonine-protein kinase n=1 Tax=Sorangium sp. So ce131 TaxID=3133282 RepID=UPI003F5F5941
MSDRPPEPHLSPEEAAKQRAASYIGRVISRRYRIDEVVAMGGMGAVYRGEHVHMHKRVAIKILHPDAERLPELVQRFEREAIAGAHIQHRNVATATDFGEAEDGSFYLVLEYVRGTTLHEIIRRGPMPTARAVLIARQLAAALGATHAMNIVHRDVKPRNVMVVESHGDLVKLIDFGLAKVSVDQLRRSVASPESMRMGPESHPVRLTTAGVIFGTIAYLAPESALGMDFVDERADFYALGLIFYELLAGKHPFLAKDPVELFNQQRSAPVPAIAEHAPGVVVPPAIEAVVRRLLEKQPRARYQTAEDLIAALDEACAASGIAAQEPRAEMTSRAEMASVPAIADPARPPSGRPRLPSAAAREHEAAAAGSSSAILLGESSLFELEESGAALAPAAGQAGDEAPAPTARQAGGEASAPAARQAGGEVPERAAGHADSAAEDDEDAVSHSRPTPVRLTPSLVAEMTRDSRPTAVGGAAFIARMAFESIGADGPSEVAAEAPSRQAPSATPGEASRPLEAPASSEPAQGATPPPLDQPQVPPEEPARSRPSEEPARSRPSEEPARSRPSEEPARSRPSEEPARSRPSEEPARSRPLEEPARSRPSEEPARSRPSEEPARSRPSEEPARSRPSEEPARSRRSEEPARSRPSEEPASKEPALPVSTRPSPDVPSQPPRESSQSRPTEEPGSSAPPPAPAPAKRSSPPPEAPASSKPTAPSLQAPAPVEKLSSPPETPASSKPAAASLKEPASAKTPSPPDAPASAAQQTPPPEKPPQPPREEPPAAGATPPQEPPAEEDAPASEPISERLSGSRPAFAPTLLRELEAAEAERVAREREAEAERVAREREAEAERVAREREAEAERVAREREEESKRKRAARAGRVLPQIPGHLSARLRRAAPYVGVAVIAAGVIAALAASGRAPPEPEPHQRTVETPASAPAAPEPAAPDTAAAAETAAPAAPAPDAAAPEVPEAPAAQAEPPPDEATRKELAAASRARRWVKAADALNVLAERDPTALRDRALAIAARNVAIAIAKTGGEHADKVFDALASRFGTAGIDVLYEIVETRGRSTPATRAAKLLRTPEVAARGTPAVRISFEMRDATCGEKLPFIERAVSEGDERTLVVLETAVRPCYKKNRAIDEAIKQLRSRLEGG